jgi:hypothetical protein
LNYIDYYFTQKDADAKVVMNRLLEILHADTMLFDSDIVFNIIKTLYQRHTAWLQKEITYNQELRDIILNV